MKKIFIAVNENTVTEQFLDKVGEKYLIEITTHISSLNDWLKRKQCDLVIIEPGIKSHGFFMDPKILNRCGTEFYRQRIQPKEIPTIFLIGHEECKKTIEGLFPNSNFGEKNISLIQSIKEVIGE